MTNRLKQAAQAETFRALTQPNLLHWAVQPPVGQGRIAPLHQGSAATQAAYVLNTRRFLVVSRRYLQRLSRHYHHDASTGSATQPCQTGDEHVV